VAFVVSFIYAFIAYFLKVKPEISPLLVVPAYILLVRVPVGFLANRIYFRRAVKVINSELPHSPDLMPTARENVRNRGGTSSGGLWAGIVLSAALRLLSNM
jgi:hypothetical protein